MAPENILVGRWYVRDRKVVGDEVCQQINHLISTRLQKVAAREKGWIVLYLDPADRSYWELSHPQGELHGGGPPTLMKLSADEVRQQYPDLIARNVRLE